MSLGNTQLTKGNKGFFNPKNPQKYRGDASKIVFRSRPEMVLMRRFDTDPNILQWSSEEVVVPYICKTDGKPHRYYPDFLIVKRGPDGKTATILIEYKPAIQARPPVKGKKTEKRYLTECMVWAKNQSKFEAAKKFALSRGWQFVVLTEREVGV